MTGPITPDGASAEPALIAAALQAGTLGDLPQHRPATAALAVLLQALGWRGSLAEVVGAVPHMQHLDAALLLDTLARLGFPARRWRGGATRLEARLLPALLVDRSGAMSVVLGRQGDHVLVQGPAEGPRLRPAATLSGTLHVFPPAARVPPQPSRSFAAGLLRRLRPTLLLALGAGCLADLLGLAGAFAAMAVYDVVIPAAAYGTLLALTLAGVIALAAELALRWVRARALAHLAARTEVLLGRTVFARLLAFPLELTAGVPVGAQIARLGQFEELRDIALGPIGTALLELPFFVVFAVALVVLAGPLGLLPLGLVLCYAALGAALLPGLRRRTEAAGRAAAERQELLLETLTKLRSIRAAGAAAAWRERLRQAGARAGLAQHRAAAAAATLQVLGAALMPLCGVATIAAGALMVMEGALSLGALVAAMLLIWRVLSPIQNLFHAFTRLTEVQGTLRQLDSFMTLRTEAPDGAGPALLRPAQAGTVRFADVTFRYPGATAPSLLGVSFTAPAGALVAITGPAGSGKTTLLRLALGLHHPLAGAVLVDGANLRNLPAGALRGVVGQVPDAPVLFHGSLAQNLRLANPLAGDEALLAACAAAGIARQIAVLPQGLATRVTDFGKDRFPAGLRQGLALAQALLRRPRLMLLDEPERGLDAAAEGDFLAAVQALRGDTTILLVTHRPSHMARADLILRMDAGRIAAFGPPSEVLPRLQEELAHAA